MTVPAWWLLGVAWISMGLAGWIVHVLRWMEDRGGGPLKVGELLGGAALLLAGLFGGPVLAICHDEQKNKLRIEKSELESDLAYHRREKDGLRDELQQARALLAKVPPLAEKRPSAKYCPTCGAAADAAKV